MLDCCKKCHARHLTFKHKFGCDNHAGCVFAHTKGLYADALKRPSVDLYLTKQTLPHSGEEVCATKETAEQSVVNYDGSPATSTHYQTSGTQPIQFMQESMTREEFTGHCKCTALKYIARAGKKKGNPQVQDLTKAQAYIKWAIQSEKGEALTFD